MKIEISDSLVQKIKNISKDECKTPINKLIENFIIVGLDCASIDNIDDEWSYKNKFKKTVILKDGEVIALQG